MNSLAKKILVLLVLIFGLIGSPGQTALAQQVIEDGQRLLLERDSQYLRTQARILEADSQPLVEAQERFAAGRRAIADGRRYEGLEDIREAARLFQEAYPRVERGIRARTDSLLAMYGSTFGDTAVTEERRERLLGMARETARRFQAAKDVNDDFVTKINEIRLYALYVELNGVGAVGSSEVLARLRERVEAAVIRNEEQIVQLQKAAIYMQTISLAVPASARLDFDLGEISDLDIADLMSLIFDQAEASEHIRPSRPALSSTLGNDKGFQSFVRELSTNQEEDR